MMDKSYFVAPEGNAPREIRALLSELTTMICNPGQQDDKKITSFLKMLQRQSRYQHLSLNDFQQQLEKDLFRAACYWEEKWRYDRSWPVIEECFSMQKD